MKSCEIIVEIGNTHEGSLGVAKSFVLMAKNAGAKTVKFQMHLAEFEGISHEPFRIKFSDQDESRQEYWKRVNFSLKNWINLSKYCESIGLEFLCTPFSLEAARQLFENRLIKRWKIGSGQAVEWPLIDYVAESGLPLVISTGLVSPEEILLLKERLERSGAWSRTTLLHCVSQYPAPLQHLDIHLMKELEKLGCKVGFSDHSGDPHTAMYAIAHGAQAVEVHLTPRKDYFGPDVSSSLVPEQIANLIEFASTAALLQESNGTKDLHFERVSELRKLFRKGVYWATSLPARTQVELKHLKFLKPATNIDVVNYELLLGKLTRVAVSVEEPVDESDLLSGSAN
jgi:N-acetylneuraminate synthase